MGVFPPFILFQASGHKKEGKKNPILMAKSLKKYFPKIPTELHKDVETSQIAK